MPIGYGCTSTMSAWLIIDACSVETRRCSTPGTTYRFCRESLGRFETARRSKTLGGRSADRSCYEHGRIRYDRLARTACFLDGLQRIVSGAADYRVALMCAEKEPLHCHRTLLIGHELDECGVDVAHILPDGRLEPHASAMTRLLAEFGLETGDDLFRQHKPRGELITEAITRQAERVGHLIEVSR